MSSVNGSKLVEIFAPEKRKELWDKIGLMPSGVFQELLTVGASAMTNVDSNYVSLAKKSMRL